MSESESEVACGQDCSRGTMESLGLLAGLTVKEVQQALNVNPETANVCIGGRRLPEKEDLKLDALDFDLKGGSEVFVCPRITLGEELLCCPEAVLRHKPKAKLGLERFLTLWILLAAGAGVLLGYYTSLDKVIEGMKVGNTNLLSAIGMISMLLPPFAAVKYDEFRSAVRKIPRRIAVLSLVMNWVIGPFLMLGLGMLTLSEHPDLLQGVVFIGAARCIAMVLVWTSLADGDSFLCVSLVLLNSMVTIVGYAPIVTLLATVGQAAGVDIEGSVSFETVFVNVAIYLGIPLAIGVFMWGVGHGKEWYWRRFLPRFAPVGLISLLLVVFLMFCEMAKPLLNGQAGELCSPCVLRKIPEVSPRYPHLPAFSLCLTLEAVQPVCFLCTTARQSGEHCGRLVRSHPSFALLLRDVHTVLDVIPPPEAGLS